MRYFEIIVLSLFIATAGNSSDSFAQSQVTGQGTQNAVPLFTDTSTLGNSNISQSNGNIGIGTTDPTTPLEVNGPVIFGGGVQPNMPSGQSFLTGSVPSGNMRGLVLYNSGGGAGSSVSINMFNTQGHGNIPQAQITAIDDGQFSDNILFLTKTPGGPTNQDVERVRISSTGNVGIGTPNPSSTLEVDGNITLTQGSGASIKFPDGTVQSTAYTGTCSTGGDYAESVDVTGRKSEFEAGDIIVIDPDAPGRFLKSRRPYSTLVAGIYSTKPGYVGRRQKSDPKSAKTEIPMAMVGIVPTKVTAENGPIKVGDLLVTSSKEGYAMHGTNPNALTGAVVGKALGSLGSGSGVIEVLVSLQ